jgi:hypothetical protein
MATFLNFNDRLPDPTFGVNDTGVIDAAGTQGPGFASVRMGSSEDDQVSRTRSGRGVHRSGASQFWTISIKYNPMTREEFDVVDTFLQARKGRRIPFFVVLPQYSKPKLATFATFVTANPMRVALSAAAGSDKITMDASGTPITGLPKPGDFFTITDPGDINHLKAYKVTRVETPDYYQSGTTAPPANSIRVHTNPPLQRFTTMNAAVNWMNPKFRVMMVGNVLEHELDTENTFEFGLQLEEIMP